MMWQSWACWLGWWTAFLNIFIVLEQLARSPETAETLLPPCLWCCCFFLCVFVCVSHKYADSLRPSPSLSITHKQAGYATFWKHTHTRVDTLTQMNRCMHICSRAQVHPHTHTRALTSRRTNQQTLKCIHPLRRTHLCTSRRCTAAHTSHLIDDLCEVLEWGSEEGGERVHQMKWICIRWSLK